MEIRVENQLQLPTDSANEAKLSIGDLNEN